MGGKGGEGRVFLWANESQNCAVLLREKNGGYCGGSRKMGIFGKERNLG
jgi:hypothetical protein